MDTRILKFQTYFQEQIDLCRQRGSALRADGRTDESIFQQVKGNIYDIFRTVLSVGVDTCQGNADQVRDFFLLRLHSIPSSWTAAYEKANAHDDTGKLYLEQLKLDTVAEIQETFTGIWGAEA